jgi:hypothetical protein
MSVFEEKKIVGHKNLSLDPDPDSATAWTGIVSGFCKTPGSGFGFSESGAETLPITNFSHEKKTGIK